MNYRKLALSCWLATGFIVVAVGVLYYAGYRITLTPSLPRGIYKQSPVDFKSLQRGQIVSFCPPDTAIFQEARKRGYIPSGLCPQGYMPLFKPVAALPGDTVQVTSFGIQVNGKMLRNSKNKTQDQQGRPMNPVPEGTYIIELGMAWLVSEYNPKSFDSRYFGPVNIEQITGFLEPVWVE